VSTKISILIPAYNEAVEIRRTLRRCVGAPETETIVADGGSDDGTQLVAAEFGAQVLSSSRGRSLQMNLAASRARGDVFLFLHADTLLPGDFHQHILDALRSRNVVAGAFQLRIGGNSTSFRLVEFGVALRSRLLHKPYGDQAIFLRRETFQRLNGYREIQIMEDLDLVRRLNKIGKVVIVDAHVVTSARRWRQIGLLKTTMINQVAVAAYFAGVSPERIARFYQRDLSDIQQTDETL